MKKDILRKFPLNVLKVLLIISIPVFLFLINLYFLVTKEFVALLYNVVPESYRFTKAERIFYSGLIIDYLKFNSDTSTIENLGSGNTNIFTQREIAHLKDVQSLLLNAFRIHLLSAVVIVSSFFILKKERISPRKYFIAGGLLTILIIFLLSLTTILYFNSFFNYFHQIFFKPDSYIFSQSEALIQLFPLEFWVNLTLTLILLTLLEAASFFVIILKTKKNLIS